MKCQSQGIIAVSENISGYLSNVEDVDMNGKFQRNRFHGARFHDQHTRDETMKIFNRKINKRMDEMEKLLLQICDITTAPFNMFKPLIDLLTVFSEDKNEEENDV